MSWPQISTLCSVAYSCWALYNTKRKFSEETHLLKKIVEKFEEADKNKRIASCRKQKCKVYKTFDIIIVILWHEPTFSPGSALRCYQCNFTSCGDPFSGRSDQTTDCTGTGYYCMKVELTMDGKWPHSLHFDIYIRQSHKSLTKYNQIQ